MSTAERRPAEVVAGDYSPHLEGLAAARLLMPRCGGTNRHWQWPPSSPCHRCGEPVVWTEVADPRGELFSWTVVARSTLQAYSELTPYVVGIVTLDQVAVRLVGRVVVDDPAGLVMGRRLKPIFTTAPDETTPALWWKPV